MAVPAVKAVFPLSKACMKVFSLAAARLPSPPPASAARPPGAAAGAAFHAAAAAPALRAGLLSSLAPALPRAADAGLPPPAPPHHHPLAAAAYYRTLSALGAAAAANSSRACPPTTATRYPFSPAAADGSDCLLQQKKRRSSNDSSRVRLRRLNSCWGERKDERRMYRRTATGCWLRRASVLNPLRRSISSSSANSRTHLTSSCDNRRRYSNTSRCSSACNSIACVRRTCCVCCTAAPLLSEAESRCEAEGLLKMIFSCSSFSSGRRGSSSCSFGSAESRCSARDSSRCSRTNGSGTIGSRRCVRGPKETESRRRLHSGATAALSKKDSMVYVHPERRQQQQTARCGALLEEQQLCGLVQRQQRRLWGLPQQQPQVCGELREEEQQQQQTCEKQQEEQLRRDAARLQQEHVGGETLKKQRQQVFGKAGGAAQQQQVAVMQDALQQRYACVWRRYFAGEPRLRNKKTSSHTSEWIKRQITDRYVIRAQEMNYRSRAAFKLAELDDAFLFFRHGQVVVDLGAYPGGWSQVAVERTGPRGRVIAVDPVAFDALDGVTFIQGRVGEACTLHALLEELGESRADVVLSDISPACIGVPHDDHLNSAELCLYAADLMEHVLKLRGTFVVKMFMGSETNNYKTYLQTRFKKVSSAKPKASRAESREMFFVCQHFLGRASIASEAQVKGAFSAKEGFL